jgi:hypothetical protein
MVIEDIKRTASELEQESSFPTIGVELVDNELAMLYMNSKKSEVKSCPLFPKHVFFILTRQTFPHLNLFYIGCVLHTVPLITL